MFNKLASAVADQVIMKLAALNQYNLGYTTGFNKTAAFFDSDRAKGLWDGAEATYQALQGGIKDRQAAQLKVEALNAKRIANGQKPVSPALIEKYLSKNGVDPSAALSGLRKGKLDAIKAFGADNIGQLSALGLGGAGLAGAIGLGAANAKKAKQMAQLKKMGLIGGGAGLAGALGLGYLMGDRD